MKIKEIVREHLTGQASPVGSTVRKEKRKPITPKKNVEDLVKKNK